MAATLQTITHEEGKKLTEMFVISLLTTPKLELGMEVKLAAMEVKMAAMPAAWVYGKRGFAYTPWWPVLPARALMYGKCPLLTITYEEVKKTEEFVISLLTTPKLEPGNVVKMAAMPQAITYE